MTYSRKYIVAFCIVAIAGSLLYFFFDPSLSDIFPKCIFHSLTQLDCPGCGSQRAIHALLNGRILQAADFNLLVVLFLPLLGYSAATAIANTFFNQHWTQRFLYSPVFVKVILTVVLLFWTTRNLDFFPFRWLSAAH